MRKFIKEQHIRSMEDTSLSPDLSELFLKMAAHSESTSSYRLSVQQYAHLASLKVVPLLPMPDFRYSSKQVIKLLPPVFEHVLKSDKLKHIRALILQFHSYSTVQPFLQLCRCSSRVCVAGELFVSRLCKSDRSSCIAAYWPLPGSQSQLSVGHVQYYLEYNIPMGVSEKHTYILACVSWFKVIQTRTGLDRQFWFHPYHHPLSMCSFIPVQRISHRCAHGIINVDFQGHSECVSVAVPMDNKTCF